MKEENSNVATWFWGIIIFFTIINIFSSDKSSSKTTNIGTSNSSSIESYSGNEKYNEEEINPSDLGGYEYAEYYDIDNFQDCQDQFSTGYEEDGCNEYVKDNYSGYQEFYGYECTEDCSGHEAGYEYAEENDIYDSDDCYGNSSSFEEGCVAYVEENY